MKGIPENMKMAARSAGPLVLVLFLFFLVVNFGLPKVGEIRDEVRSAKTSQNSLTQKINILQDLSLTIGDFSSSAAVALPDSNTALAAVSQLKILALQNGLFLTDLKTGPPVSDALGLMRVDVNFDVEGGRSQVSEFLRGISRVAPITVVSGIDLNESGGVTQAGISVKSFWAPLPKTLPTSEQAVSRLTPEEEEVLSKINTLTQPVFSEISPTSGGRTDPFNP
ncbi:MAG TPA: hypothetical protein VJ227_04085 [Patescibacteria group bacterium]|nr:hypothetical protein [Patescibacteria group bacterium]